MSPLSAHHYFDAHLPRRESPVRIASFNDAKIFARRWVIRDKDLDLKALVRRMEKANSSEKVDGAVRDLKLALETRGLLCNPDAAAPK